MAGIMILRRTFRNTKLKTIKQTKKQTDYEKGKVFKQREE
jgi:hypothetical protein